MPKKDRPLVDRHPQKNGEGWLLNEQEQLGLMAVTMTVVMTRMIVFAAVFFTGRPNAMPLISTLATHFLRLFDGLFFRSEGVDPVGIFCFFGVNSGDA